MAAVGGGEGDDGDGGGGKAGCLGGGVGGGADALSVVWVPLKAQPGAGLATGSAERGDGDGVSGDGNGDGFCQESGAQIHGVGGRQMFCWKMVSQTQLQLALQHVPWLKLLEMQILHKLDWQAGGGTAAAGDAKVLTTPFPCLSSGVVQGRLPALQLTPSSHNPRPTPARPPRPRCTAGTVALAPSQGRCACTL